MAKYGPASIVVNYDDSGGTPQDMTQYVLEINGVAVENILEEVHSFGDSWEEHLPIGVARMTPVELSGLFDDTASTGPDAVFGGQAPATPASTTRTLKFTWGGTKTTEVETHLISYERSADRNGLTRYTARLQPTGTVTEV